MWSPWALVGWALGGLALVGPCGLGPCGPPGNLQVEFRMELHVELQMKLCGWTGFELGTET